MVFLNKKDEILFTDLLINLQPVILKAGCNNKDLEKIINNYLQHNYNKNIIKKTNGEYCTKIEFEPNGSQLGPDWRLNFSDNVPINIELKTSKTKGIHLNEGIPEELIIFVQYDQKTRINLKTSIILIEDYEPGLSAIKKNWDVFKKSIIQYSEQLINPKYNSFNVIETIRVKWKSHNLARIHNEHKKNKDNFYKNLRSQSYKNFLQKY